MMIRKRQQHPQQNSGVVWLQSVHRNGGVKVEYQNDGGKETTTFSDGGGSSGEREQGMRGIPFDKVGGRQRTRSSSPWGAGFFHGVAFSITFAMTCINVWHTLTFNHHQFHVGKARALLRGTLRNAGPGGLQAWSAPAVGRALDELALADSESVPSFDLPDRMMGKGRILSDALRDEEDEFVGTPSSVDDGEGNGTGETTDADSEPAKRLLALAKNAAERLANKLSERSVVGDAASDAMATEERRLPADEDASELANVVPGGHGRNEMPTEEESVAEATDDASRAAEPASSDVARKDAEASEKRASVSTDKDASKRPGVATPNDDPEGIPPRKQQRSADPSKHVTIKVPEDGVFKTPAAEKDELATKKQQPAGSPEGTSKVAKRTTEEQTRAKDDGAKDKKPTTLEHASGTSTKHLSVYKKLKSIVGGGVAKETPEKKTPTVVANDAIEDATSKKPVPTSSAGATQVPAENSGISPYTLERALQAFDVFDDSVALLIYDPSQDQFVFAYPDSARWERSRFKRIRTALTNSLRRLRPDRFRKGAPEFAAVVASGDYPQYRYDENECYRQQERSCVSNDFPPVLQFGSVFKHPAVPSTIAMPMPERNHLGCFHQYMENKQVCKLYRPRGPGNPLGLVFGENVGSPTWEDLVPQVVWRATDRSFLSRVVRLRRPDFGTDVAPYIRDLAPNDPDVNGTATRAMRKVYSQLVPRWKAIVQTAEAEREAERTGGLPWADIKFADAMHMGDEDDTAYYQEFMVHGIPAVGGPMGLETLAGYRYQLDIGGGGGTTWSGTLEKLAMPGLLFHHETRTKDYIHDIMKPWVHYVPISSNLGDLREKYDWAEAHPDKARRISERGTALVRSLGTTEGFQAVFEKFYEEPLRKVVDAYRPLGDGTSSSSWRELIRRRGGDKGLRPMWKCGGYQQGDCGDLSGGGGEKKTDTKHEEPPEKRPVVARELPEKRPVVVQEVYVRRASPRKNKVDKTE